MYIKKKTKVQLRAEAAFRGIRLPKSILKENICKKLLGTAESNLNSFYPSWVPKSKQFAWDTKAQYEKYIKWLQEQG